ncbi:DMT family transporter [Halosolutus gelatinilyticus]|uniref:DMT family transporter n=1 Tax=Halosolutus gelatinilyticus TaxID=2931975 RepID=UPI001FF435B5|nr:DMT family transporter [Halosolutus gelatinilyticus]
MRYGTAGLFVLLAAIWGLSFVAARAALPHIPPVPLAALRFDIVAVATLAYAIATTDRWYPETIGEWRVVVLGGTLFVAVHHALLFAGQQYVTSAVASVVMSLDPVLAAGFAWPLLADERLDRVGALGLCLGLLGVVIVANPTLAGTGTGTLYGVLLVFLSAAAFALGAVLTRRYRTALPVRSMQAWMMLVGAPLLHLAAIALPLPGFAAIEWTRSALFGLAYLALVAGVVGYLLYFELLDRIGAVEINLIGYAAPVFAAIGGWAVLGEPVAARTVAGFGVIVCGFVLVKRDAIRTELARRGSPATETGDSNRRDGR